MALIGDYHLHSSFSGDCETPMEDVVKTAIAKGLKRICMTEHCDLGFPNTHGEPADMWDINVDSYLYDLLRLRSKYEDQIELYFGIELGLQQNVLKDNLIFARSHEFDFIIASSHFCNGKDPYYADFFEGRTEEEALGEYFKCVYDNIKLFHNFDVYGHLDYPVRYAPTKDDNYSYDKYKEYIDPILELLLENEKGLELNTAALDKGLKDFHPCMGILKRYRELGGEIITIGSDAHKADEVGRHFDRAYDVLKECGFKYYSVFANRLPEYVKLV